MFSRRMPNDVSLWTAAAAGAFSFIGGLVYASYAMRLRDRERLRNACSRIEKHLQPPQRVSLGPVHLKPVKEKETILVIGCGSYGKDNAFWKVGVLRRKAHFCTRQQEPLWPMRVLSMATT